MDHHRSKYECILEFGSFDLRPLEFKVRQTRASRVPEVSAGCRELIVNTDLAHKTQISTSIVVEGGTTHIPVVHSTLESIKTMIKLEV
jgi:hypothetical protein